MQGMSSGGGAVDVGERQLAGGIFAGAVRFVSDSDYAVRVMICGVKLGNTWSIKIVTEPKGVIPEQGNPKKRD